MNNDINNQQYNIDPNTGQRNNVNQNTDQLMTSNMQVNNSGVIGQNVNQSNSNEGKKKNNSLLFIIIGCIIFTGIVGFCLYKFVFNKGEGLLNKKDYASTSANVSETESVAIAYTNLLIQKNYADAMKLVYMPKNSIITVNDFSEFVQKEEYFAKLTNSKVTSIDEQLKSEKNATYSINLKDNTDNEYSIVLKLNIEDGKWYIQTDGFYITGWSMYVPGNSKIYIDDVLVDTILREKQNVGDNGLRDYYVIPGIVEGTKKVRIETDIQNYETEFTVLKSNNNSEFNVELKDSELINKAYDKIKNAWNEMYLNYTYKKDVSTVKKFFADNMDLNQINVYYKQAFDSISGESRVYKNSNFNIVKISNNPNETNYVSANDIITINFGYTLSWLWNFMNETDTMNRYSSIRLKYQDGNFLIYEITDEKLFTWANQYTHDF